MGASEIVLWVEWVGRVDMRTRVAAIDHGAGIPESPAGERSCTRDAGGVGFDEVELVGWVVVYGTAKEGEENEEGCAGDENEGDEAKDGPYNAWIVGSAFIEQFAKSAVHGGGGAREGKNVLAADMTIAAAGASGSWSREKNFTGLAWN